MLRLKLTAFNSGCCSSWPSVETKDALRLAEEVGAAGSGSYICGIPMGSVPKTST